MSTALRPEKDQRVFTGQAAAGGGTVTFDYDPAADRICYIKAVIGVSRADASHHLLAGGGLNAEYWIENKNGTLAAGTVITTSANPMDSGITSPSKLTSSAEVSDSDFNNSGGGFFLTARWTIAAGGHARLTVTNNSTNSSVADIGVWMEIFIFGST